MSKYGVEVDRSETHTALHEHFMSMDHNKQLNNSNNPIILQLATVWSKIHHLKPCWSVETLFQTCLSQINVHHIHHHLAESH